MSGTKNGMILTAAILAAFTSLSPEPLPAAPAKKQSPSVSQLGATDFSAARRRTYYRRSDRAAIGAFMGIVGTIAGIAAAERYRRHYYDYGYGYGYGYAPYYAYPPSPYYGPYGYGPYYGLPY